jgi:DNA polymerase III alpha subunit (gram-positive type)
MRALPTDSQKLLHDSLFELYMIGGLELFQAGTRGLKRDLIIDLETSALTPDRGEIIHFRAVNRWDEDDFFDEWAKPSRPLSPEAEMIVGTTNERLMHSRPTAVVLADFLAFIDGAELVGDRLDFDLAFMGVGISHDRDSAAIDLLKPIG